MTSASGSVPTERTVLSRRSLLGVAAAAPAVAVLLGSSTPAAAAPVSDPDRAVYLTANDMTIATGSPSLFMWNQGSAYLPVWSLSGGTTGQSVVGVLTGLPTDAIGVEVQVIATSQQSGAGLATAFRVHLAELVDGAPFESSYVLGAPVVDSAPGAARNVVTYTLQSFYAITQPGAPVWVRIQREPGDPGDSFTSPMGLIAVRAVPVFDV